MVSIDRSCAVTYADTTARTFLNADAGPLIGRLLYDLVPDGFGRLLRERAEHALDGRADAGFEAWCPAPVERRLRCRCLPSSGGATVVLEDLACQDKGPGADTNPTRPADKGGRAPAATQDQYKALSMVNENLERIVQEQAERHRQAIGALEKQKETLKAIFDSIPGMLVFHDSSQQTSMANRAFERLTGWSPAGGGFAGLLADIFPDPGCREEAWSFMMAASGTWKEFEITTRSGETLTSSWLSVRLSDGSLIGIGVDLRLCRLCAQMGNDLAKFAAAVEQVEEGIALVSLDETVEYINPAFEAITGYTRLEVIGRKLRSFADYFADERHGEIIDSIISQQRAWSGRQKRRRKNGEIFDVSLSITPIRDDTGCVVNYVSIMRDITREAAAQQQLQYALKMEALGALARGIAHDLKNIFSPILLDTETLMQDMGVQHPFYPVLDEIHKATTLGIGLVNQIRIFSHSTPREKAPLDLYPQVRQFLSFFRSIMSPMIDINYHLCPEGAVVMAEATQIQQVLMNLCINARHAMRRKGGLLTVGLVNVDLNEKAAAEISPGLAPGPYVEIMVEDTGEGMDTGTVDRIFEPFFTTKKPGEGSGMGLAVVHGIVRDHKGAITVRTRPGEGSSFRVLLPRLPENTLARKPGRG